MLTRGLFSGLLVLLLGTQLLAAPASVQTIRIAEPDGKTRVVLDLDQTTDHKLFTLLNPHRVVVDLPASMLTEQAIRFPDGRGMVSRIRGANRSDGSVRIVLDLGQPVRTLVDSWRQAGFHSITWDGTDDSGQGSAAGVYIYKLTSAGTPTHPKSIR